MSILGEFPWSDVRADDRVEFTRWDRRVRDLAVAHLAGHAGMEKDFHTTVAAAPLSWRPYLQTAWDEELAA